MGLALLLWLLVSLLSISLVGNHPLWALGLGAAGGIGIGFFLCRQATDHGAGPPPDLTSSSVSRPRSVSPLHAFFFALAFLVLPLLLLLSSRLPPVVPWTSAALLLCLWVLGRWTGAMRKTPLDLPIGLLALLPATLGLYASPDFQRSVVDVFQLIAGVGFFYALVWWGTARWCVGSLARWHVRRVERWHVKNEGEGSEREGGVEQNQRREKTEREGWRLNAAVVGFMCLGAALALGSLLVMATPTVKLPVVSRLFAYLPHVLPRRVNPNYVGGALVFFAFVPLWLFIWGRGWLAWVAAGAVWGGLLLAQSRGALLGAGVALAATLAFQYRWARWLALLGVVSGVFLLVEMGIGGVLDPVGGAGVNRTFEGRLELWQRAVYIAQDFSFSGIGLRGFPVVVDLLYPLFLIGPNARMPHAHNLFLQVAVDAGIPGFVAFWMLLGAWGAMVWEALCRTSAGSGAEGFRPLVLGLFGGLAAHLVYGVTDAITLGEKAGAAFWVVLGLTVAVWRKVRAGGDGEIPG